MRYRIWTVLFLVIVVCVSTSMLNAIYTYTDPIVRRNEKLRIQKNVLEVFQIPHEEYNIQEIFGESVNTQTIEGMELYRSSSGNIAFQISGPGFWGAISALIALEPDLETIKGLKILENKETPGLGGRIADDWFQDQFRGKKLVPELKIVPHGEKTNEVDAITGATQTSKAFEKIINTNFRIFYQKVTRQRSD
jgi:Na+-transporting NADH:ubiquinone oxidoreductase subunit C